jgi:hypothetical protein
MATITKTQLRERVAEHLKVKAIDRPLSAEHASKIDDAIDDARAELRELGLCWWGANAIPQSCAFALKLIVSAQACIGVGKAGQGYESGDVDGRTRLAKLKPPADINPVRVDYF